MECMVARFQRHKGAGQPQSMVSNAKAERPAIWRLPRDAQFVLAVFDKGPQTQFVLAALDAVELIGWKIGKGLLRVVWPGDLQFIDFRGRTKAENERADRFATGSCRPRDFANLSEVSTSYSRTCCAPPLI
jgi:hypothetical protein